VPPEIASHSYAPHSHSLLSCRSCTFSPAFFFVWLQGTATSVVVATQLSMPGKLTNLAHVLREHTDLTGGECSPADLPSVLLKATPSQQSWGAEYASRVDHGMLQSRFTMLTGRVLY
jgi:hypothetical protein